MKLPYSIETYNLTKRYPVTRGYKDLLFRPFEKKEVTALNNINIQIKKGELVGLLGPNGAGKTTLIKILCTLVLPSSGKVFINGFEVEKDEGKIKKIIGLCVDDERSFYWRLTGRQNLKFFAKLNNISGKESEDRIKHLLEFVDLTHEADRMFKDYSTGMRQKLAIARGLLTDPEIIFMDEPTNGLDPITAQKVIKFIREKLVEEEKKTVVFASHNLHEVEILCNRIIVIDKGMVKITGGIGEIKRTFCSDKKYRIDLKGTQNGLLEKIQNIPVIHKITTISDNNTTDSIQIEIEMKPGVGDISQVVGEIITMGGKICSLYEKETSLRELFARIII